MPRHMRWISIIVLLLVVVSVSVRSNVHGQDEGDYCPDGITKVIDDLDCDGYSNEIDHCPYIFNEFNKDNCHYCDDGVTPLVLGCPSPTPPTPGGSGGNQTPEPVPVTVIVQPTLPPPDQDEDGIVDARDQCPTVAGTGDGCLHRLNASYAVLSHEQSFDVIELDAAGDLQYITNAVRYPQSSVISRPPSVIAWTGEPITVALDAERGALFMRDKGNALWVRMWSQDGWSEWANLDGILTSTVAAVSWEPDRIDIFGIGDTGELWHQTWNAPAPGTIGNGWSANWEPMGKVGTSAPIAVSPAPNRLTVFMRGEDNGLWYRTWDDGWKLWMPLGGQLQYAPEAVSVNPNRIDVFVVGIHGELWHKVWNDPPLDGADDNGWSTDWDNLFSGGFVTTPTASVSAPIAMTPLPDQVGIFIRSQDNALWYLEGEDGEWRGWNRLGGQLVEDPVAFVSASGLSSVVRGVHGDLWHINTTLRNWEQVIHE